MASYQQRYYELLEFHTAFQVMKNSVENQWKSRIQNLLHEEDINDDLKDVTFEVKDREGSSHQIKCHKFVLSLASPVFKLQFYGSLKVEDNESIKIIDAFHDTFKNFIHFIYNEEPFEKLSTIESCEDLSNCLELYYLGEKYQIAALKSYLHLVICNSISINSTNVIQFLQEIEEHSQFQKLYAIIKELCFSFLDSNVQLFMDKEMANIDDINFMDINTMYQLLRRKSLKATEYNVYKIAKAYSMSITEDNGIKDLKNKNIPKFLKDTVDFTKMSLKEIRFLLNDTWLPQEFRWDLSKTAIEINSEQLKPSVTRSSASMVPLQMESGGLGLVSFQFTSNQNVLLQILVAGQHQPGYLPTLNIEQEGLKETINIVGGKHFVYIEKNKPADVRMGTENQHQPGKIKDITTESFNITFSDVKVYKQNNALSRGFALPGNQNSNRSSAFSYSFCHVPEMLEPASLIETNQSGFEFPNFPANLVNFNFGGSSFNKENFSFGSAKTSS